MENPKSRAWKVVKSEYLARKPWFTVRHERIELPDGRSIPDYYVFGHYHVVAYRRIAGSNVVILGDWLTNMSFATFNGEVLDIDRLDSEAPGFGFSFKKS